MTREEAIHELQNCKGLIQQDGQDYLDERDIPIIDMAIEALSADAEQGEWINNEHDIPICSQCGYFTPYDRAIDDYEYGNYCPNCGARMKDGAE